MSSSRRSGRASAATAASKIRALTNENNEKQRETESDTVVVAKKRRVAAKLPLFTTQAASPIVFQVLKSLIDRYTGGTRSIVDAEGFTAECQRVSASCGSLDIALHHAARTLGFTFRKGTEKSTVPVYLFCGTQKYDGQLYVVGNERVALKSRLTKLAGYPQCKYVYCG